MFHFFSFIILFSLSVLGSIPTEQFYYETALQPDKDFIRKNQQVIAERAHESENYWGVHLSEKVKIEIQPVSENPYLFQCSRIYDSNHIYAQSPDSLRHLNGPQRKAFNSRCLSTGYADLTSTIIHEYNHILHLRYVGSGPNPVRWVWEGAAQYLSREVQSEPTRRSYSFSLRDFTSINLCKSVPPEDLTSEVGGLAVSYYESTKPKVLLSLAKAQNPNEVKKVLDANRLPCVLSKNILLGELKRNLPDESRLR